MMSKLLIAWFCVSAQCQAAAPGTDAQKNPNMQKAELDSEEFRQTYQFAAGSRLEVSNVAIGSFLILPPDTVTAEVRIARRARNRAELAGGKLVVEHTPTRLVVRGDEKSGCPSQDTSLSQNVILKIPRESDVSLSDIHGPVVLGEIEGRGPN